MVRQIVNVYIARSPLFFFSKLLQLHTYPRWLGWELEADCKQSSQCTNSLDGCVLPALRAGDSYSPKGTFYYSYSEIKKHKHEILFMLHFLYISSYPGYQSSSSLQMSRVPLNWIAMFEQPFWYFLLNFFSGDQYFMSGNHFFFKITKRRLWKKKMWARSTEIW